MSYGLRTRDGRLHGLGLLDGRGLGVYNPPDLAAFGLDPNGGGMHCDPRDVPCVQRQNDASNAYEEAKAKAGWDSNRDDCLANLKLNSGTPEQMAAGLARCNAAYADSAAAAIRLSVAEGMSPESIAWAAPLAVPASVASVPVAARVAAPAAAPVVLKMPAAVVASGAAAESSSTFVLPTVAGFDLTSIPWWGWAAAAGVALFAFGGGRGR
jgi:hypothetical protein